MKTTDEIQMNTECESITLPTLDASASIDPSELLEVSGGILFQKGQSFQGSYPVQDQQSVVGNLQNAGFVHTQIDGYRNDRYFKAVCQNDGGCTWNDGRYVTWPPYRQ